MIAPLLCSVKLMSKLYKGNLGLALSRQATERQNRDVALRQMTLTYDSDMPELVADTPVCHAKSELGVIVLLVRLNLNI